MEKEHGRDIFMRLENVVVHLIGFGGVGKYTIAKILAERMGAKIVDNHLILNPVFSVIDLAANGGEIPEEVWVQVRKIRAIVLETMETLSPAHYSFIFTNILTADSDIDRKILNSFIGLAEKRGATYVPVRLFCDVAENAKRIVQPERAKRLKPTDVERVYHGDQLIDIASENLLDLDVTKLSADDAAEAILKHVQACLGR